MEFQSKLKRYWKHRGDHQQGKDMLGIDSDSHNIVINGMSPGVCGMSQWNASMKCHQAMSHVINGISPGMSSGKQQSGY